MSKGIERLLCDDRKLNWINFVVVVLGWLSKFLDVFYIFITIWMIFFLNLIFLNSFFILNIYLFLSILKMKYFLLLPLLCYKRERPKTYLYWAIFHKLFTLLEEKALNHLPAILHYKCFIWTFSSIFMNILFKFFKMMVRKN